MRWLVVPMALLIFLGSISVAWAQVQSHPLSQISPIDSNLNMYTYNNSVGYLNYSYGILNNGTQGILTADIASSAVTGSRIASNAITSSKISNPLGGLVNATAYYDSDNSNYFLDSASSGTSLVTAGSVGVGTTSPAYKLDVYTPGAAVAMRAYGGVANSDNVQLRFAGQQDGETWAIGSDIAAAGTTKDFEFYSLASGQPGTKMAIQPSGNVGIGTTSPVSKLDVNGSVTIDTGGALNINSNVNSAITMTFGGTTNEHALAGPPGQWRWLNNAGTQNNFDFTDAGNFYVYRGNVGIGTSSPSSGNGGWTRLVEIANPTDAAVVFNKSSGPVQRWVAGVNSQGYFKIYDETRPSDVFTILNGSDNIGIGTTSPSNRLDVAGTVGVNNGANIVYRCTTAGTLPVGALTVNTGNCGATADTGLRVA